MELVTPEIGLIFWTTIVFLLLLIVLKKYAWKPILAAVDERNKSIEDALKAADKAKKEMLLKQLLTSEARLRLNNVKMVKPELANMVENYLLGLASQGRATGQITDEQLKQILLSVQQPKRDFKFKRI